MSQRLRFGYDGDDGLGDRLLAAAARGEDGDDVAGSGVPVRRPAAAGW